MLPSKILAPVQDTTHRFLSAPRETLRIYNGEDRNPLGKDFPWRTIENGKDRNLPGRISLGVRLKLVYHNVQYLQVKSLD